LGGDFVALTIADTGCGIAPDILPRVFDPFFTTKGAGKGTGLGLSQVYGFAHQSGGTVVIKSELGVGTSVTLYLPRAQAASKQPDTEDVIEPLEGGLALLVEDNPDVAEATWQMIEQLGYRVKSVDDAGAALVLALDASVRLVVSDIVMPGSINGLALARALRERRPELPVVLATSYSNSAAAAEAEFTVLRKPYQPADLSRAIAKAMAEAQPPGARNIVRLHDLRPIEK
jgi:CheY-like chemotaxis protein